VLITGHEGFLGSNLAKALINCGAKVIGIDKVKKRPISILNENGLRKKITAVKGDIACFKLVDKIIKTKRPSVIFHLAAEAIVSRAHKDPLSVFKSNIEGTWNILEASRGKKYIKCVVVASSDKAYGESPKLPYTEDYALAGSHPYDASKSCADILALAYSHSYDVPVSVIRCGNIYGPGDFNFSRLVPDAIQCALKSKRFIIRSDGTYTRDFVYVSDIVDGYLLVAEKMHKVKKIRGEAFNLSNEKPMSVFDVFTVIGKTFRRQLQTPLVLNKAKYEIRDQFLSSQKAKQILGWRAEYPFAEGLKETIEWYKRVL